MSRGFDPRKRTRLGRHVLGWLDRASLIWAYYLLAYVWTASLAATGFAVGVERSAWSIGLFSLALFLDLIWRYLADCERVAMEITSETDLNTAESKAQALLEKYRKLNMNMGGNVGQIIALIRERIDGLDETSFLERCKSLQQMILRTIADTVSETIEAGVVEISANWMPVSRDEKRLELTQFDMNAVGRERITLELDSPKIGAVAAYHLQDVVLIEDIKAEEYKRHFRENAPYRCILSVPVRIGNVVGGIVNIDSTSPKHLDFGLENDVLDGIYLVGLLEDLPRKV